MSKIYNIKYLRGKECVFFVGLFMAFLILLPFNNARCEDTDEADRGEVSAPQTVKEELKRRRKGGGERRKKGGDKDIKPLPWQHKYNRRGKRWLVRHYQ